MAPLHEKSVNRIISPAIDHKTGAVYYRVKTEDKFSRLPLKLITRNGHTSRGLKLVMVSTNTRGLVSAENFLMNFTDDSKNEDKKRKFMLETAILQSCDHPNIVKLFYSVIGPRRALILTDFYPDGPLLLEGLRDDLVKKYFLSILGAVNYLHSKRIVHRDIKCDNIMVKNQDVILTDLGSAIKLSDNSSLVSGLVGSLDYMAPEVLSGDTLSFYDGFKADSYSIGVCLMSLMNRSEPYIDGEVASCIPIPLTFTLSDNPDAVLTDCANGLLTESPTQRMSVRDLHTRLTDCGYLGDGLDVDVQLSCGTNDLQDGHSMDVRIQDWETLGAEVEIIVD